ncbi:MAG: Fe2+-dependent dioxygenase [Bryobacteraceae bacterium]
MSELEQREFADGKLTASGFAKDVKHNLQLKREGREATELDQLVYAAFERSKEFQAFAIPKRVAPPIFSRYDPGMKYGAHVDNAFMGGVGGLRSDLSVTLFLSPPDTYDGGELVVEMALGEQPIKLDAGEAIVYPSSSIHYVAAVTRGVRYAAVTWVQSAVPDERIRSILYDIQITMSHDDAAKSPALSLLLSKSYNNLLRHASHS